MKIKRLSVIIPCFQEKENVRRFQLEVIDYLNSFGFETEFIIVDDGSTDGTSDELIHLAQKNSQVKILAHPKNAGLGACFLTAFPHISGDAVLTLDADLTFSPQEFPKMLEAFTADTACVNGSPFLGDLEGVVFFRKILTHAVNLIYRTLLGGKVTAVSSIFRLYRTSALNQFQFSSRSFQINAEIIIRFILSKLNVVEVPVTLTKRLYGKSKINFLREIWNHLLMFKQIIQWRMARP